MNKNNEKINFIMVMFLSLLPLGLLVSSGASEITCIILILLFLTLSFLQKKFNWIKEKYIYLLLIIWLSLIVNFLLAKNSNLAFSRSIGFIRYIILIPAIAHCLKYRKNQNLIFFSWLIILLIIGFDIFFEYFNKVNIIGIKSSDPSRIASFLGKELKIGHFVLGFMPICIGYYFEKINKNLNSYKIFGYFLLLFLFIAIILTGERSNSLRALIFVFLFILLADSKYFKFKKILTIAVFIIVFFIYHYSSNIKNRFDSYLTPIKESNLIDVYKKTQHGAHAYTAIEIFKSYPLFGIGNKNFREECHNEKYNNKLYGVWIEGRCSTHPHQIYLELLSEHGIVGASIILFIVFFLIIKNIAIYLKKKNLIHLGSILFVSTTFIPFIPSGSFFTSWGASIFWVNFSVMIFYYKSNNISSN
jgi:cell division protein FtsW (lipid II flippase)